MVTSFVTVRLRQPFEFPGSTAATPDATAQPTDGIELKASHSINPVTAVIEKKSVNWSRAAMLQVKLLPNDEHSVPL